MKTSRRAAPSRGFTLIELLVVIMILATLAGLAVSRVDWARRSADTATAAAGITQAHENVQIFRTMKGVYPNRFDSLIDSTTVSGTPAIYDKVFRHVAPRFTAAMIPAPDFSTGAPTGVLFSLIHAGIDRVMDNNPAVAFPSDSGTVERELFPGGPPAPAALVTVTPGSAIEKSIYPDGVPVDADGDPTLRLIALGLGPSCTLNGTTMASPPISSAVDPAAHYGRFIAIFAAYESGKRAELKAFVDSTGQVAAAQLKNYYENTPE